MPILWQQNKIVSTIHVSGSIELRDLDWSATLEGYQEGDAIGYGATEQAAIADLQEQLTTNREDSNAKKQEHLSG